jgi:hypothetical protein
LINQLLKNNINDISLIRIIKKNFIFIKNRKILFIDTILNSKLIETRQRDMIRNIKIGSFDIECYENKENNFISYACKWKIDNINKTYYLTDFKNHEDMLEHCFIDIFKNCIGYTIYAHNLSSFDGILIIKTLYKISILKYY